MIICEKKSLIYEIRFRNFLFTKPVLFGTWDGVFTTVMVNIFGVIVFLRMGWIVVSFHSIMALSHAFLSPICDNAIMKKFNKFLQKAAVLIAFHIYSNIFSSSIVAF